MLKTQQLSATVVTDGEVPLVPPVVPLFEASGCPEALTPVNDIAAEAILEVEVIPEQVTTMLNVPELGAANPHHSSTLLVPATPFLVTRRVKAMLLKVTEDAPKKLVSSQVPTPTKR